MTRQGLLFVLCGLLVVAALVGGFLYYTRGNHLELTGKITKVRTLALDENSSLMIVDFHLENPSDVQFVVRNALPQVTMADGSQPEAQHIADSDIARFFEYYQDKIGPRQHPTLITKEKVPAHKSEDKMVAAGFKVPEEVLKNRKSLALRLEDLDGAISTIQ